MTVLCRKGSAQAAGTPRKASIIRSFSKGGSRGPSPAAKTPFAQQKNPPAPLRSLE